MRQRELEVAREIAHAFLNAGGPLEVYRLSLIRVTPLLGATFASVFLRDDAERDLLRLVCAQNWPQSSARFLSELRIRVGRGPTGVAVESGAPVEVEDVFQDPELREWWEPARELGFTSLISLPLRVHDDVLGAVTFYFEGPHRFSQAERRVLSLTADQLAATAERAHLIEDLRNANQRLRRQNEELGKRVREAEDSKRLKNEFLANVSHELRTPLTSILGYTYLLSQSERPATEEMQKEALVKIERSANVLLGLIGDLIDLSQLKLGRTPIEAAPEDAVQLAERAVAAGGTPREGVVARVENPEQRPQITTDGEKVLKILTNLVSNALKFTRAGEVVVGVRALPAKDGRHAVEWEVRDTGIGIASEELEAIFDEFRQVDGSSTRLYGGTGLGLALSLRLARLLGGDIHVESEPGAGSAFKLWLPEVQARAPSQVGA